MRKLLAIFLLLLFAFNLGGYHLLIWALQYQARQHLMQQADADAYTSADEVLFRVPITLPYTAAQEEFTRVNGAFEHDGEFYQLIKQKIVGGELLLVCIKNHQQKKLTHVFDHLTKISQSVPGDSNQAWQLLAKLFKDYQFFETPLLTSGSAWSQKIGHTDFIPSFLQPFREVKGPPPRLS